MTTTEGRPIRAGEVKTEARPMRADAVKNRQRILDAAEEVFAAEGLTAPIDVVAERAGVGVGTLYRHFPTKEALFEAIVVTRLQSLLDEVRARADAGEPGEALFSFLREFAGAAMSKHDLMDALAAAGVDLKSQCTAMFEELQEGIGQLLERAVSAGACRSDVSTHDVVGLVVGACRASEQLGLGVSCERMLEVVLDGLRRSDA